MGIGVNPGLHWVRRRQHSLARVVLALFCAAWLQAALVPCVMAHGAAPAADAVAAHSHDDHGGHDRAGMPAGPTDGDSSPPCVYCPPGDAGTCDGHGGCAFPHDPQVDARAAGLIFTALPASFVVPLPAPRVVADRAGSDVPDAIPRVSLTVSYCRFIE